LTRRGHVVVPGEEEVTVQISTDLSRSAIRRAPRALFVLSLGPACALGGLAWALLQPYRITLLHPYGQGFWWLLSEPPIYVALVGLLFHWLVAPGVIEDLEDAELEPRP
jgi:hypothetical protein